MTTGRRRTVARRIAGGVVWMRYLATGTPRRLPMAAITNEFAFAFGTPGWNYVRALVAEHERRPAAALEATTFFRFFQHPEVRAVRTLNDVLFLHRPERRGGYQFYLGTYPWGDHVGGGPWGSYHDRVEDRDTRDLYGHHANIWYAPGDPHALALEWTNTLALEQALRAGYRPLGFGRLPEVTLLVRRDGAVRAMRYDGQHRLAILAHRGVERLTVLVPSVATIQRSLASWPSVSPLPKIITRDEVVVRESRVDAWSYVRRGLCTREQALEIFHAFFELNGRERIQHLGLPPEY